MHNYQNLKVWERSVNLATKIYEVTQNFPDNEKYGITSQIRRSVVSISSNIAEGSGRGSDNEFKVFLNYSYGSCCELETQLLIARNLRYIRDDAFEKLSDEIKEIKKIIFTLINKFK